MNGLATSLRSPGVPALRSVTGRQGGERAAVDPTIRRTRSSCVLTSVYILQNIPSNLQIQVGRYNSVIDR